MDRRKVYLENVRDPQAREKLEVMYSDFQMFRSDAFRAAREAECAQSEATIAASKFRKQMALLLLEGANYLEELSSEPMWDVYRDREGRVTFEALVTSKDQRNAVRAATRQAAQGAGKTNLDPLFGDQDNDDSPGRGQDTED